MPNIDRWSFIKACLKEIEARLGVVIPHHEENLAIKGMVVDPERYRKGIQMLRQYAPADKRKLFDDPSPEISPNHVASLIAACLEGGIDNAHLTACEECRISVSRLMYRFGYVLNGSNPDFVGMIDSDRIRKRR